MRAIKKKDNIYIVLGQLFMAKLLIFRASCCIVKFMAKKKKKEEQLEVVEEVATVVDENTENTEAPKKSKKVGAAESIVSILCYLGAFIVGSLVLKLSKQNRYIRFNAAQSTIYTLSIIVVAVVLNIIPVLGSLLSLIVAIGGVALWVIMIIKATKHEEFRIPLISYFADKLVDKLDQKAAEKEAQKASEE